MIESNENLGVDQATPRTVLRLGYLSAICAAVWMIAFDLSMGLGFLAPSVATLAILTSLLIAPSFVAMMSYLHRCVREEEKVWTQLGLSFAIMYATLALLNYFLQLSVVRRVPHLYPWLTMDFVPESAFWALEVLLYTLLGFAGLAMVPLFSRGRVEAAIRWLLVVNGVATTLGAAAYLLSGNPLHVLILLSLGIWAVAFPVVTILIAHVFKRSVVLERPEATADATLAGM